MCFTIPKFNEYRRFTQTAKIMHSADDGLDHICSRDKVILAMHDILHKHCIASAY